MKTSSYKRSRSGRNNNWGAFAGISFSVVFVLTVIIFHQFIGGFFTGLITWATIPKTELYQALPKSVLASRLANAEEELSRIKYQAVLYAFEVEQNANILKSLGLPSSEVVARGFVIARPPRTHYDTLLVSLSSEARVAVGDYAYASGILMGDVIEQDDNTALVSLFSSPGRTRDVRVGNPSAIVVMHSVGGGSFVFEVPKKVSIEVGDSVVSAHDEQALIAIVQNTIDEPERTTLRVHAAAPLSLSDTNVIEFVRVSSQLNNL